MKTNLDQKEIQRLVGRMLYYLPVDRVKDNLVYSTKELLRND